MSTLIDMHSHLDFADNYDDIARDAANKGISAICSTVTPSSFVSATSTLKDTDSVAVSLGLHPWWVAQGRITCVDVARFESLIEQTNLIGEIGLDFGIRHKDSIETQIPLFEKILDEIASSKKNFLITLHAQKSAGVILDKLDQREIFENNTVLFHWFSGTEDEFGRACSRGCFFSVGMKMLATKTGAKYACAIPEEYLLIESDLPANEGAMWSADLWLHELNGAVRSLSELREVPQDLLSETLQNNSTSLLKQYKIDIS